MEHYRGLAWSQAEQTLKEPAKTMQKKEQMLPAGGNRDKGWI
jgi:hypothetical protein